MGVGYDAFNVLENWCQGKSEVKGVKQAWQKGKSCLNSAWRGEFVCMDVGLMSGGLGVWLVLV